MIYTEIFINNPLRMPFKLFKDADSIDNVVWDPSKNSQCHVLEITEVKHSLKDIMGVGLHYISFKESKSLQFEEFL